MKHLMPKASNRMHSGNKKRRIRPGTDVDRLTRHYAIFPTLAAIAGASIPAGLELDGRSVVPLIKDPGAEWPDRNLFFHIGRWNKQGAKGRWGEGNTDPDKAKYHGFAGRNDTFRLDR